MGIVHDLGQKVTFFHVFCLSKKALEKVFGDVLIRRQAFLDNINMDLKRRQN